MSNIIGFLNSGDNIDKRNRLFFLIVLIIYSSLTFIAVLMHEPWRDEAQIWMVSRDLDFIGILKQMHIDGTPALWYIVLFPFTHLGFPYIAASVLNWIIVVMTVYLILYKSPFTNLTKILFVFSHYIFFEYAIIARGYLLSVFLLFLIAVLYKNRFKNPVIYSIPIFLLFNTNLYSFGPAFMIFILFFYECVKNKKFNTRFIISNVIILLGAVVAYLQVKGAETKELTYTENKLYIALNSVFSGMKNAFAPYTEHFTYIPTSHGVIVYAIFFVLFLYFLFSFYNNKKIFVFYFFSILSLFFLYAYRVAYLRHYGFLIICLFFALWISSKEDAQKAIDISGKPEINSKWLGFLSNNKYRIIIFNILLLPSVYSGFSNFYYELKYKFSNSREAAYYIKDNNLQDFEFVSYISYCGSSLLPYLPEKKFWYPDRKEYGTYIYYNRTTRNNMEIKEVIINAQNAFPDLSKVVLLFSIEIPDCESYNLELIYTTKGEIFWAYDEKYYFYIFKGYNK